MPISVPAYSNVFAALTGKQSASKIDDNFTTIRTAVNGVALQSSDIPDLVAIPSDHGIFDVKTYGAAGNGVTDDTAAIQVAIDAAQAVGGVVFLPTGNYKITAALEITAGVSIVGCGAQSLHDTHATTTSASVLFTTSTTIDIISVNTTEACHFRDFTLIGSTSAASGAGIKVTGGTVDGITGCQRPTFARLTFQGLFYGIQYTACVFSNVSACVFEAYTGAGIDIANSDPDHGDHTITGCLFSGSASGTITGVSWHSGGGLYISSCKFLGNAYGIHVDNNSTDATSDFLFTGNSIENFDLVGCLFLVQSTGTLLNITLTGNQFLASVASSKGLTFEAGASATLANIAVTGNTFSGNGSSDVAVEVGVRADAFTLNGNTVISFATGLSFNTIGNGKVTENIMVGVTNAYSFTAATNVVVIDTSGIFTVATRPLGIADGSQLYITDAKGRNDAGYNPTGLLGSGNGTIAWLVNGVYLPL